MTCDDEVGASPADAQPPSTQNAASPKTVPISGRINDTASPRRLRRPSVPHKIAKKTDLPDMWVPVVQPLDGSTGLLVANFLLAQLVLGTVGVLERPRVRHPRAGA